MFKKYSLYASFICLLISYFGSNTSSFADDITTREIWPIQGSCETVVGVIKNICIWDKKYEKALQSWPPNFSKQSDMINAQRSWINLNNEFQQKYVKGISDKYSLYWVVTFYVMGNRMDAPHASDLVQNIINRVKEMNIIVTSYYPDFLESLYFVNVASQEKHQRARTNLNHMLDTNQINNSYDRSLAHLALATLAYFSGNKKLVIAELEKAKENTQAIQENSQFYELIKKASS